jgi:hypothetical protein
MRAWKEYQEETAAFFHEIGMEAHTDQELEGVRTSHKIDVVVRARHIGFEILWIVECKRWRTKVSKLHILALREIATDLGADRGILMAEAGFQRGAQEAASLTNVTLTSLARLGTSASHEVGMVRLHALHDRVDTCRERYWNLPKSVRIEHGLRPDVPDFGFQGARIIEGADKMLSLAIREKFPIRDEEAVPLFFPYDISVDASGPNELCEQLEPGMRELERRLSDAESAFGVGQGVVPEESG